MPSCPIWHWTGWHAAGRDSGGGGRWRCPLPNDADMDLAPAEILSNGNAIFVPSSVGKVYAVAADGSRVLWARKLSNTVINHILPLSEDTVVVSTMDGIVACLKYTDR